MEPMTGMLSGNSKQDIFELHRQYKLYAEKTAVQGRQPVPFDVWVKSSGMPPVAPAPSAAPIVPVRGAPSSSFQDPYEVDLARRRAEQAELQRRALEAERLKRRPGMITGR